MSYEYTAVWKYRVRGGDCCILAQSTFHTSWMAPILYYTKQALVGCKMVHTSESRLLPKHDILNHLKPFNHASTSYTKYIITYQLNITLNGQNCIGTSRDMQRDRIEESGGGIDKVIVAAQVCIINQVRYYTNCLY